MATVVYSIDYDKANDILGLSMVTLRDAVALAIARERERCALVVENMGRRNGRVTKVNKLIAAQIRLATERIAKPASPAKHK